MSHHCWQHRASVGVQTDETDFAPAAFYAATASPAATYAAAPAPLPVIDCVVPAPAVNYVAPAPVIEDMSSAPVIEYIAPAPAVSLSVPSQLLPYPYTTTTHTTDDNFDVTDLVNPQFSISAVEASPLQVVGSLPPLEEFDVPVYNQIHREQIVAGR